MKITQQPIDAVVTWVDGADSEHQQRRHQALESHLRTAEKPILSGQSPTRFIDSGELRYCLRGLQEFAPWIRRIFIVTDRQCPPLRSWPELNQEKIKIIDHSEIFHGYEWAIPTFNSLSIETMLWRIPELSEQFIYFNDDFFILRDTYPSTFFYDDGVKLIGSFNEITRHGELRWKFSKTANSILKTALGIERSMSALQQILAAQMVGCQKKYFRTNHTPYPLRKSTLSSYFSENEDELKKNIKYRFRDASQFSTTALANHLEIRSESAQYTEEQSVMICFNRETKRSIRKKIDILEKERPMFLCLQSLEQAPTPSRKKLDEIVLSATRKA